VILLIENQNKNYKKHKNRTIMENENERASIGLRIKELIHELRMNNNSFAVKIGATPTSIGYIVNQKNKPRYEFIEKVIQAFPEVSQKWLMSGEGPMFITSEPKTEAMAKPEAGYLEAFLKQLEDKWRAEYGKIMDEKDAIISNQRFIIDTLMTTQKTQLGKLKVSQEIPHVGRVMPLMAEVAHSFANTRTA
jgi:DNA-binding XRE family transcriptional regulator